MSKEGQEKKKKNLIPKDLSKRKDHKEISAKGGRAKTKAKKHSAQLRAIKEGRAQEGVEKIIQDIISDPDASLKDILKLEAAIGEAITTGKLKLSDQLRHFTNLLNSKIRRHVAIHGEKKKVEHAGGVELKIIPWWKPPKKESKKK